MDRMAEGTAFGRTEADQLDRRTFVLGASALAALSILISSHAAIAQSPAKATSERISWEEAMHALIGDAKPVAEKIALEMPPVAENGNVVPFTVLVDSPMTETSYVKVVHLFATSNMKPDIASFYFGPENGKASVSSRMRLLQTQDVIAVAETSTGEFYMTRRNVKVTIGCCGG
jgi:sulfur-oxidizing protein SoxY